MATYTIRERFDLFLAVLSFPFVLVRNVFEFFVRTGARAIELTRKLILAVIGLALLGFLIFGLARVLLYPLFH